MRDPARELAEALQALGLVQLALQAVPFGLGLEPFPLGLQFQPLPDVADRGHDEDALAGVDGGQRDLGRERAAITAAAGQVGPVADLPGPRVGHVPGPVRRVPGPERVRDQDLHQLAGQLLPPVPEKPLGLRVHQHDAAVGVHAHHRVGRRLEQPAEPGIGPLLAGDIPRHRRYPTIAPVRSTMGDSVIDTLTVVPSLRTRSDWYCSTRSPRVIAAWIFLLRSAGLGQDQHLNVAADHLGRGIAV